MAKHKIFDLGASSLSDAELLNNILNDPGASLRIAGAGINEVARMYPSEMMKKLDISEAKAIRVISVLELARRKQVYASAAKQKKKIISSRDIAEYFMAIIGDLPHEAFAIAFLNRANVINHTEIVAVGGVTGVVADPRVILKKALHHNAVSIILSHNHPSGEIKPSSADNALTTKVKEAVKYLDITLLDHVIVTQSSYYSYADEGLV